MNILITGGCGFIGLNLGRYLCERGYTVSALDNLSTANKNYVSRLSSEQNLKLIIDDIRNTEALEKVLEDTEAVVHLAAYTSVVGSIENPEENWEINAVGTFNLLEACRKQGSIDRFVFASSNAVLGEQAPPIDESKIPQPLSPYGASKAIGESLCSAYYHSFGLNTFSLRFANVYGPYSDQKGAVIDRFIECVKHDIPLTVYGDGNQTRDFVHVDDICQAIHRSLENQTNSGEIFQIASGKETSINSLIGLLKKISDKDLQVNYEPARRGEIRRNYSDITKSRNLLGFTPKMELMEGLREYMKGPPTEIILSI